MRLLIIGANGFIGSNLSQRILKEKDWKISAIDIEQDRLDFAIENKRFNFFTGDIAVNHEWIEYHIKISDVIFPLVAIANPIVYIKDPLTVFSLNFEENLRIIRLCVKYNKRLIFPSTSEVYGMCSDREFEEDSSNCVVGPINKQRWIYSCSKQLLDRVIWAYGKQKGLRFTLIRPFNWIGPNLDSIDSIYGGSPRVVTQFIGELCLSRPLRLVGGGLQKRCFTYIDDGLDCLMKIIEDKENVCIGNIFNIGNPNAELSIRELAIKLRKIFIEHPLNKNLKHFSKIVNVEPENFYGEGYQDIMYRLPSIQKARELLGWKPHIDIDTALAKTLDYYLNKKCMVS